MFSHISYLSIGTHRQNRRIWIEGKRLASSGFDRGQRYAVILDVPNRRLVLEAADDGDRTVSGRHDATTSQAVPIIDLCNADVTEHIHGAMGNPQRVRVTFEHRRLTISLQEIEANERRREARLRQCARERRITEGVVCAGGGISAWALAEGLKDEGYDASCEWLLDREGRYLESAMRNLPIVTPDTRIFEATVEEIEPTLLPPVDVLSASLPCTGFSLSGISKKHLAFPEADVSGTAFIGFLGIVRAVNPSVIVHENVPRFAESITCHIMTRYLRMLGYDVHERILDRELGAFEKRNRHIMVAVSRGVGRSFSLDRIRASQTAPVRLGEILEAVPSDSPRWKTYSYLGRKEARDLAAGKGFRRQMLTDDATDCGTIGRGYHKARSTEPFVVHPMDPSRSRLLTPAEHAAVKGIPSRAVEGLSDTIAHEILGQSVLFPVFRSVGRHLGGWLDRLCPRDETLPLFA